MFNKLGSFDILLTMHLNIFILILTNLKKRINVLGKKLEHRT